MQINAFSKINPVSSSPAYTSPAPSSTVQSNAAREVFGNDMVSVLANNSDKISVFVAGGINGYKYHNTIAEVGNNLGSSFKNGSVSDIMGSVSDGVKTMGTNMLYGSGIGALVSGGTALVTNSLALIQDKTSLGRASANVVGDTIHGAVGGAGAVVVGGGASLLMRAIGFSGTPLLIAGVLGGAVGASLSSSLINTSSLENKIRNSIDA